MSSISHFLAPSTNVAFPYQEQGLKGEPWFYKDGEVNDIRKIEDNIVLVRTSVNGNVSGKTVRIHRGTMTGNISSEGNIWVNKFNSLNELKTTKGAIKLRCSEIEKATADAGSITITNCPYVGVATAKNGLKIHDSIVFNASTETGLTEIVNSQLKQLECRVSSTNPPPIINNSSIDKLIIKGDNISGLATCGEEKSMQETPQKVKLVTITLFDSMIDDVVFEGVKGEIHLMGKSKVHKIKGKIVEPTKLQKPKKHG